MKVKSMRLIAKPKNSQFHSITIYYDKHVIRPNTPIIIILIEKY